MVPGEPANAQTLRRALRRCTAPPQRFTEYSPSRKLSNAAVVVAERPTSIDQEMRWALALLPDYTRCMVVCRQPVPIDADDIEELQAPGRPIKEAIESLDRDPGKAFGYYLQALTGAGFVNSAPGALSELLESGQIRMVVCGRANYLLPDRGPAGATQSDQVSVYVYDRPFSETWREFARKRTQQSRVALRQEGNVEFFQDEKHWIAFAPPNAVIIGDKFAYFHDVLKLAARTSLMASPEKTFVDLVDPGAALWFAYFAEKKSPEASPWPVRVLEYAPNKDWSLTLLSGGSGLALRPKHDSTKYYDEFESELLPGSDNARRQLKPLIAKGRNYASGFVEMRFSVRDHDLESGEFPILLFRLMGIAVFI